MRITCETKDTLPLSALTEFQGGLKKRTAEDTKKIEKSINDYGFATPFFVWRHDGINSVLDGHGRLQALKEMQQRGENIPALPVVYIDCANEAAAKNLLLRICSTYGEMTAQTVRDFIKELEIAFDDIRLPCGTIDLTPLDKKKMDDTKKTLRQQFLVPPFSVLDTRQGYWQDRKKQWKSIGIKSEEGRDNKMLKHLKENASIDYLTEQEASGAAAEDSGSVASESINGYSYSYDKTAQQEAVKRNAKSAAEKKIDIIKLYNNYRAGVC